MPQRSPQAEDRHFFRMVSRVVTAAGRRAAAAPPEQLAELLVLESALAAALLEVGAACERLRET